MSAARACCLADASWLAAAFAYAERSVTYPCHSCLKRSPWVLLYAVPTSWLSASVLASSDVSATRRKSEAFITALRVSRIASSACCPRSCSNWAPNSLGDASAAAAGATVVSVASCAAVVGEAGELERLADPEVQATPTTRTKMTRATRPVRERTMPLLAGCARVGGRYGRDSEKLATVSACGRSRRAAS